MRKTVVMYGVKYVNSPGFIALYAFRQDAVIRIADSGRKIEPRRVVVTYEVPNRSTRAKGGSKSTKGRLAPKK